MRTLLNRRGLARTAVAALVGALAIGLTACGSGDDTASGGEALTITHARGETVIEGTPQRIVTLGNQWLDTALALDAVPVGYIDNVAIQSQAAPPWQPAGELDGAKSIVSTANISEQVAALEPDLILIDPFIADQKTYDDLSRVAPVVPGLTKDTIGKWQDQVTTLGKILGKQDQATAVVTGVEEKLKAVSEANPGLKGKTFASTYLVSPSQLMVLTDPNDGSARLFAELGMTIPQNLIDQPGATGGRLSLSTERVDQITADLLLAGYSGGMDEKYRQLPGYNDLNAVKKGAVAFLTATDISAVNQPTALSVPYIVDKLGPTLAAAAK